MNNNYPETMVLPVLPLRGLVVFPKSLIHFDVGRSKSIVAINRAMKKDQFLFLVTQKDPTENEPKMSKLYTMGVIAKVVQVMKQPDNVSRIVIEGQCRAAFVSTVDDESCLMANIKPITDEVVKNTAREQALVRAVKKEFEEYMDKSPKMPPDIIFKIALCKNSGELADFIASNINVEYQLKQIVLESDDCTQRLETVLDILTNENYLLNIEDQISSKAKLRIDESQRDFFLREQKRVIEEELGEEDNPSSEAENYIARIEEIKLDEKSENVLLKECRKLTKMPYGSQEASVIRTYLDTVLDLPWNTRSNALVSIPKLRRELDKSHFGLNKIKEIIIEQFAVSIFSPDQKGQIICFAGPPGVGKTSIAHSIAKALKRECQRIALGGVKDEAEIRGHRRTYIGSIPGRIMTAISNAGTKNPLIILDEVDKLCNDFKGDPTSALLEVLDSEQNNKFVDHYIDIPFDLSDVLFITTANDVSAIPSPLRDRMEIIEISSYTAEEKLNIAQKHLVPKQLKLCGFTSKDIKFTKKGLAFLIEYYTREAGVRTLERCIASIIRKCAVKMIEEQESVFKIDENAVESLLGTKKYLPKNYLEKDEIGVVNGLAWTSVGGELLPIEVAVMEGTGKLELTGSLGDVMQESAKAAITCIRSHADILKIDADFYKNTDIHIHAPEGAVPKDGPSAGITMATAIFSALSKKPIKFDLAMTGEITLRGKVLPIGGLKEKSMAAYKHGIKNVIIPKENESDLQEVDEAVKQNVKFIPVSSFYEVITAAVCEFEQASAPSKKTKSAEGTIHISKTNSATIRQ